MGVKSEKDSGAVLSSETGTLKQTKTNLWTWSSPSKKGTYSLQLTWPTKEKTTVQVFVMVPFSKIKNGYLNGYRIGTYPKHRKYPKPRGFVEVKKENLKTKVSNSFRIDQFLCKQSGGFPKYLVLDPKLLIKLEAMLEIAKAQGYDWSSFHIMSGYRTPHYNRLIKNVKYSRHQYGQAADIFVDNSPYNTWMDDINKDGKISVEDAFIIYSLAEQVTHILPHLKGGLGLYKTKKHRGPFLHVDARGYRARWGVPFAASE